MSLNTTRERSICDVTDLFPQFPSFSRRAQRRRLIRASRASARAEGAKRRQEDNTVDRIRVSDLGRERAWEAAARRFASDVILGDRRFPPSVSPWPLGPLGPFGLIVRCANSPSSHNVSSSHSRLCLFSFVVVVVVVIPWQTRII